MRRFLSSLRFRLLLLVVLALVPALVLIIYTASEQSRLAMTRVEENALRLARAEASNQEQLISGAQELVTVLAQIPAVRDRDPASCNSVLADILEHDRNYLALRVVELDGSTPCAIFAHPSSTLVESTFARSALEDVFRRALETRQLVVGSYMTDGSTGKSVLAFGYPIADERVQAVIINTLDITALNRRQSRSVLSPGSAQTVIDHRGTVLARYPNPDQWVGQSMAGAPIFRIVQSRQQEGTAEAVGMDGVSHLYAFTPLHGLPGNELFLTIGIPTEVAFAEVNFLLQRNLLALGIVAALALGAAWFGSDVFLLRQLNALLNASQRIQAGDLTRTGLPNGPGELGRLAHAFDSMAGALEQREAEHKREVRLRVDLLHQVIKAQEEERLRIARELHDETSQSLTMLMLGLDHAAVQLASDTHQATGTLRATKFVAEGMLDDIHRLIQDLRPSALDLLGLESAIQSYGVERLGRLGITLSLDKDGLAGRLPGHMETVLFRIAQEAFTNIVRHANASNVAVRLAREDGHIVFQISDNGQGFDPGSETKDKSYGLRGMQERAAILQGEFCVMSAPGKGTVIRVKAPLPEVEVKTHGDHSCLDRR